MLMVAFARISYFAIIPSSQELMHVVGQRYLGAPRRLDDRVVGQGRRQFPSDKLRIDRRGPTWKSCPNHDIPTADNHFRDDLVRLYLLELAQTSP